MKIFFDIKGDFKNGKPVYFDYISIEIDGETYSIDYECSVAKDVINNIEKVEYKSLNGMTYIYITVKKPVENTIKVTRI